MAGGVSTAAAQYLGVSLMTARIVFVIAALFGGLGIVVYSVLWLFVPDDHERVLIQGAASSSGESTTASLVAGLAALTASAWITQDGPSWLASILVVVGVFVMSRRSPTDGETSPNADLGAPPPPPSTQPPPFTGPFETTQVDADVPADAPTIPDAPMYPTAPVAADTITTGVLPLVAERPPVYPRAAPGPRSAAVLDPPAPRPPKPPKPAAFVGPLTVSIAVALAGSLSILDAIGAVDLRPSDILIAVLVVVGLGLLISTWFGRARGLILLGLLLVPTVAVSAVVDRIDLRGGTGERTWAPTTAAQLQDRYRLGAGSLELDLTDLDTSTVNPDDPTLRTELSLGTGEVRLIVPEDWSLEVTSTVDLGTVWLYSGGTPASEDELNGLRSGEIRWDLGDDQSWYFPQQEKVHNDADGSGERRTVSVTGKEGAPVLDADIQVTAGVVEVFRVAS
jgi:phage shock protein PspC (stress-responsive transcriptional regulator)